MTPEAAMKAGRLAMLRKELRDLALLRTPLILGYRDANGSNRTIYLDAPASRAAIEAADLDLSDRLLKLGVSEHEHIALPAPEPEVSANAGGSRSRSDPRINRVPKPPQEPA